MNPIPTTSGQSQPADPYSAAYALARTSAPRSTSSDELSAISESRNLTPHVRVANRALSITDVVRDGGFRVSDAPPETALLTDRRDIAQFGLTDVIEQIRERVELYYRNLRGIAYATVSATNAIHTWKAERGWPSDRQLDNLHKTLQGLYEQERSERISLWRDLSRIRQTVPEWAQQYLASVRKIDLLEAGSRDGP